MKVLILAGGKSSRLRPYTTVLPKPMLPVGDYPVLEIILRQLKAAGVTHVTLAVGYLGHIFQAFFQDGSRLGLSISYSFEEKPLGTAGPIALSLGELGEDFIVMNGDLLTTLNYGKLFQAHLDAKAAATIATYKREVKMDFGVIESSSSGLDRYIEKPVYNFDVSMGINVLNSKVISRFLKSGQYLDIPDLMIKLKEDGQVVHCHQQPCYWLDMGRMDDYQTASEIFETRQGEFLPDSRQK